MKAKFIYSVNKMMRGSSLLEELIALVIVSIGLLGMTRMQLASMKDNQVALDHTQASSLACEIFDLMRANRTLSMSDRYNLPLKTNVSLGSDAPSEDLYSWKNRVAQLLPNGDGSVSHDGTLFTVTIQWSEAHSGGETEKQFVIRSEL